MREGSSHTRLIFILLPYDWLMSFCTPLCFRNYEQIARTHQSTVSTIIIAYLGCSYSQ